MTKFLAWWTAKDSNLVSVQCTTPWLRFIFEYEVISATGKNRTSNDSSEPFTVSDLRTVLGVVGES